MAQTCRRFTRACLLRIDQHHRHTGLYTTSSQRKLSSYREATDRKNDDKDDSEKGADRRSVKQRSPSARRERLWQLGVPTRERQQTLIRTIPLHQQVQVQMLRSLQRFGIADMSPNTTKRRL